MRATAGITRALIDERPVKAILDPYNPIGSTAHVNFNTSKRGRCRMSQGSAGGAEFTCVLFGIG